MTGRAQSSGVMLCVQDVVLVKGMLNRGDRQHDIAAWFGVNSGRISEIATGHRFQDVAAATASELPPRGPYPKAAQAVESIQALKRARAALFIAENTIKQFAHP